MGMTQYRDKVTGDIMWSMKQWQTSEQMMVSLYSSQHITVI